MSVGRQVSSAPPLTPRPRDAGDWWPHTQPMRMTLKGKPAGWLGLELASGWGRRFLFSDNYTISLSWRGCSSSVKRERGDVEDP